MLEPMKNLPLLIGTIVGTLILVVVVAVMFSGGTQVDESGSEVVDLALVRGEARLKYLEDVPEATDSAEQSQNEVVTVVEFSDFQCPACKASQPAVENIKKLFPGQVEIVFRHFPLDTIHPNARLAAISSEVVFSLDNSKFWPYHDRLFVEQQSWSDISSRDELKNTFASYAAELGLDRSEFLERMEDNSFAELVNLDVTVGTQLGVNATPTFYVNGIKTTAQQLQATVESVLTN